ncbi:MAG: hypothetical protein ABSD82_07550 [Solirubrobacteraceae bacterium]|jgi:hypothetical protein
MATVLVFHEVEDVDEWLRSPRREEIFTPIGVTVRLFRDPQGSNRVGMILEVPDMAAFEEMLASDPDMEAAKADGVRIDTAVFLNEA